MISVASNKLQNLRFNSAINLLILEKKGEDNKNLLYSNNFSQRSIVLSFCIEGKCTDTMAML